MPLSAVNFHITNRCPLDCAHCLYDSGRSPLAEADTTTAILWIDQFADACGNNGTLNLFGGEPLLRADVLELIARGTHRGMRVGITTSASAGRGRFRRLLRTKVERITIDLHGATEATHDRIRRLPGHFVKSVAALQEIAASGHKACVNVPLARYNSLEIPQILDLAKSLGVYAVSFYLLSPAGRGTGLLRDVMGPDEWLTARKVVMRWLNEAGREAPLVIWERAYEERRLLSNLRRSMCRDPDADSVDVRSDGVVFACGLLMSVDGLIVNDAGFGLGNLNQTCLSDILKARAALVVAGDDTGCPALACHANPSLATHRTASWCALDPRKETHAIAKICPYDWQELNNFESLARAHFVHVGHGD
jgi:MoaA/NifB/PqqE/SkfB family radical SAM enzyme